MTDFYLTLPSNSSMSYYPGNTLSDFTTRLPNPISLTGDWEVGLVEIQYPHNWFNVPSEESARTFRLRCRINDETNSHIFRIADGYYPTIQSLLEGIQLKANRLSTYRIQLSFIELRQKVSMDVNNCKLTVPPHIRRMLGMSSFTTLSSSQTIGDSAVDMQPVDSLYVYCDVIEPRVVGDSQTPLLRIVPAKGKYGELITQTYENIHYIRVQTKTFQTIEINIRERTGSKVPFESGTLNVTLHFRQRKRFSTLW